MLKRPLMMVAIAVLSVIAASAYGQRFRLAEGPNVPVRFAKPGFNDGGFGDQSGFRLLPPSRITRRISDANVVRAVTIAHEYDAVWNA